jgi:integrase/recombinase XerD
MFYILSRQIGLRAAGGGRGPRLHDFRHRFALQTLLRWYRNGEDPQRRLPILSTYLGHAHVTDTYWYLTNTPELLGAAGKRHVILRFQFETAFANAFSLCIHSHI